MGGSGREGKGRGNRENGGEGKREGGRVNLWEEGKTGGCKWRHQKGKIEVVNTYD